MPNLQRPSDFVIPPGTKGLDIVLMIDNRTPLTQESMMYLLQNANEYIRTVLTSEEARSLKDNNIWWNQPYTLSKLGFIPESFSVHEGKLFIQFNPT